MRDNDSAPIVIANGHCAKAQAVFDRIAELGLVAERVDVDQAERYASLFVSGKVYSPALVIGSRAWRNPAVSDIEKLLARSGRIPSRLKHFQAQARFVWYMALSDAFASYTRKSGRSLLIGHIEIAAQLRGKGLGTQIGSRIVRLA